MHSSFFILNETWQIWINNFLTLENIANVCFDEYFGDRSSYEEGFTWTVLFFSIKVI